jgi:hypothetical protein
MNYLDTVKLATTTSDGYGDQTVTVLTDAKALFIQRTSEEHQNNADGITSDAAVYLDPTNSIVVDNAYRLEGMYIIANPLGGEQSASWYQIAHVTVGQRKLLNNAIDNIYCLLEKQPGAPYVSYIS